MSDFLVGTIIIVVYGAILFTWVFSLIDLFARRNLSGLAKVLWLFGILFFPVLGVFVYWLTRPRETQWWAPDANNSMDHRTQQIGEFETLVRLRNQGTITDEEFDRMKGRVMA
jgi:Phospholipase_D-nuclease N-terminal